KDVVERMIDEELGGAMTRTAVKSAPRLSTSKAVTLAPAMREICGPADVLTDPLELRTYECDGLTSHRTVPALVVLPETAAEVAAVVRVCAAAGVPFVARGSGTGLSGGAVPHAEGVLIVMSRMRQVLEVDPVSRRAVVEPGVTNLSVTQAASPYGLFYAPDPSSQVVCSVGGNVAENSGGAHCLKYGFTTNHVLGAKVVLADGNLVELGGPVLDGPGYDLRGALVGSEGTLCVVVEVTLRILRKPEATRTFFATFPSTDEAGNAVSLIIAAGIVPAAIEMMDRLAIVAIKAATGVDWPDVGAALLMDVDGPLAEVEHTAAEATRWAQEAGALEIRVPRDAAERDVMWRGRKSAFAAMGRISPNYVVQDGVIPRSEIAPVLRQIAQLSVSSGLRIANVFHAGDGNLHPLVLYDAAVPGQEALAEHTAGEILEICVRTGGSITGEHGVGADKAPYMTSMFSDDDLATMNMVRCAFDPDVRMNPGKVFPTPRLCGDRPGKYVPHATETTGLAGRG
ncbi:MAG TPA: FAD-linked oxidase C-terminal domain-containing protein, partial [Polyangiaceae bacterium]|nr:FAD-linked oxidase C-terminal domain-containing protein [Polyangiaceae bacterium]